MKKVSPLLLIITLSLGLLISCVQTDKSGRPIIKSAKLTNKDKAATPAPDLQAECEAKTPPHRYVTVMPSPSVSGTPAVPVSTCELIPSRPTDAVFVNRDFCSCLDGKPDIINNCAAFCVGKGAGAATLYGSVFVGPEIENNPKLKNLSGWCTKDIGDGNTNPGCELQITDGSIISTLPMTITAGTNQFTVSLTPLNFNVTYVANILEKSSGAVSNSFQIRRTDGTDAIVSKGPLAIAAISQYFCVERGGGTITTDNAKDFVFNGAGRLHYYFTTANEPPPLAATSDNFIFCHDIQRSGLIDNASFPRLGLTENFFYMWGVNDSRFFDLNGNSKLDINDEIKTILEKKYGIKSETNIFFELPWANFPGNATSSSSSSSSSGSSSGSSSSTVKSRLGYIMQPWVDSNNNAYCLTQKDYNSDSPLFKILKDYVGVDTEGLYVAVKEPETLIDPTTQKPKVARDDYLLISESRVKKLWFFFENNQAVEPDKFTVKTQTLHFYWPPNDTNSPYIRTGSQKLYTVRSLAEINNAELVGLRTTVSASDKRIACVPKTDVQPASN